MIQSVLYSTISYDRTVVKRCPAEFKDRESLGSRKQGTTRPGNDPATSTPAFSWISPNLCDDGHDAPCVTGAPGGLAQADAFLAQWVPTIMAAPAYQQGGLIVITFDEGSDSAARCGEASGFGPDDPNVPLPGRNGPTAASARSCCPPDQARQRQHRNELGRHQVEGRAGHRDGQRPA